MLSYLLSLLLLMGTWSCGDKDRPTAPVGKGKIVLAGQLAGESAGKATGVQTVDRMAVRIWQDTLVVLQQDLQRKGTRWQGDIEVGAGAYTVELEAFMFAKVKWQGSTSVEVKSGKTSRAAVLLHATNTDPVANAGEDQRVAVGVEVRLDGSGSQDADGDSLTYSWASPSGVALEGENSPTPRFTPSVSGLLRFQLSVSDGLASSDVDEVTVRVNTRPIANAGVDQQLIVGATVQLDGSESTDGDGDALGFRWTTPSGIDLSEEGAARPRYIAAMGGVYRITLVVNDGIEDSDADEVVVTVNTAPVASAGSDQSVLAGAKVWLDGTGSRDVDGDVLTYKWDAPAGIVLTDPSTTTPQFVAENPGEYRFVLVVNDDQAESTPDEVVITVSQANRAPIADAGPDQIVEEDSRVELDGSGSSDPDGDIITYSWVQVTGPIADLSESGRAVTWFTVPSPATYSFALVVNDGQLTSEPDEMVVVAVEASAFPSNEAITVDLPGGATMDLVWIEPGTFTMGSPDWEQGRESNEGPQHEVTISQGFYLGKYELTQGQWEAVLGTTPWSGGLYLQSNANHPAVIISWDGVQEFIQALNAAAGDSLYRLPTEAEWEYACRAGTTTGWSLGDDENQLKDYAWYRGNAWNVVGEKYAHEVGTKLPNPFGLYDMHGNVWEWCQDWYGSYSSGAQVDPMGPSTGSDRVKRGGYFGGYTHYARSGYRSSFSPNPRSSGIGARLLRMAEPVSRNKSPVANAGSDKDVEVGQTVLLDGSGSSDPDGDQLSYRWTQMGGPEVELVNQGSATPQFLPVTLGVYVFALVVNDGQEDSDPDEVVITVNEIPLPSVEGLTVDLPGGVTMEFVWIEAGTFVMGSPETESGRAADEGPQHEVTITRGFYLGKFEVTQEQWEAVMNTTPWWGQELAQSNPNHPAVYVSWGGVQEYLQALNQAEGEEVYRLPTEAEWEYACRAGTTTRWSFGEDEGLVSNYAWYSGNAGNAGQRYAHRVGLKSPNLWGLHDMHGNVWEWCQDNWYRAYTTESEVDPTGPFSGAKRVARGGSFIEAPLYLRSAGRRYDYLPDTRIYALGMRLVRMADPIALNHPPEVDAGEDQTVEVGAEVQLDGSRSSDPDGDELSYRWTQVSGLQVDLSGSDSASPSFTLLSAGEYAFSLVVSDGQVDSDSDEVVVTANQTTSPPVETITADLPGGATMALVWIEPGAFTMGSPFSEEGRLESEGPQREVTIGQGFYLGKYEITQYQWESVMGTRPWSGQSNVQANPDHPAVYVSWDDMQEFVRELNQAQGAEAYRLPTEAEWEYACRAGTSSRWPFGENESDLESHAWYRPNTWDAGMQYGQTVGQKHPNAWGLYDMLGNVFEWCQDWYGDYPSSAQTDPMGSITGSYRVKRSGGFANLARYVRSASRSANTSDTRNDVIGARLLRMTKSKPPNEPPVARAGPDLTVKIGERGQLYGSGSTDPDGDHITYLWVPQEGLDLAGTTLEAPEFVALTAGIYRVSLVVNDGKADSDPSTVVITVVPPNRSPIADAGIDETVGVGEIVQLDGSLSSDPDGDIISYTWTAPPEIALSSSSLVRSTFTATEPGVYRIQLTVSDSELDASDVVTITAGIGLQSEFDGKIAFAATEGSLISGKTTSWEIYVAQEGAAIQLTDDLVADVWVKWSPDGSRILFQSDRDGDYEIYLMDENGTNIVQLTDNNVDDKYPFWSPDGSRIAFVSESRSYSEIFLMGVDGKNVVQFSDIGSRSTRSLLIRGWSPDGKQLSFSRLDSRWEFFWMSTDDGSVVRMTDIRVQDGFFPYLSWSPDGRRLALTREDGQIYIMESDGTNEIQLTDNYRGTHLEPTWSPDGSQIVYFFLNFENFDESGIFIIGIDGENRPFLTHSDLMVTSIDWWQPGAP